MHIVGGFYREQCCMPTWDAVFGSGGRAAAAVSFLSPGSILHTYTEDFNSEGVASLKKLGIEMRLSARPTAIVFVYFHPLSRPYIQPAPDETECQPAIQVKGDAVLRFGFLEGDAIVDARRAVYDPQTCRNPVSFGANGSVARELAIVLNELELRSATGVDDLKLAALYLMEHQQAEVVVVKGGIRGATVFERGGRAISIPAYRSSRVFKIGTGDVFSAIFAHYWAEKGIPAGDAADMASRSVAGYCIAGRLPIAVDEPRVLVPVRFMAPGSVLIEGSVDTLGQRYTMEEARFVLRDLGVEVFCPALDGILNPVVNAILVIADGLDDETVKDILAKAAGTPIVVLREGRLQAVDTFTNGTDLSVIDDFASALYFAAWAAAECAPSE
jgi:hypothetical protein